MKPKLLDLFCGAGGCAMGYHRAGFDVTGVDINFQKRYPFEFVQGDALEYAARFGHLFNVIHASPPCQKYLSRKGDGHIETVELVRHVLLKLNKFYIIENVESAPLFNPIKLCGTMFGLLVLRHRIFETSVPIYFPPSPCSHQRRVVKHGRKPDHDKEYHGITGHFPDVNFARKAMGINWMIGKELSQAIPPAYTEWLGKKILELI